MLQQLAECIRADGGLVQESLRKIIQLLAGCKRSYGSNRCCKAVLQNLRQPLLAQLEAVNDRTRAGRIADAVTELWDNSLNSAALTMLLRCSPAAPSHQQVDSTWQLLAKIDILPSPQQLERVAAITVQADATVQLQAQQLVRCFTVLNSLYNKQLPNGTVANSNFPIRVAAALQPVVDLVTAQCVAGGMRQYAAIDVIVK